MWEWIQKQLQEVDEDDDDVMDLLDAALALKLVEFDSMVKPTDILNQFWVSWRNIYKA